MSNPYEAELVESYRTMRLAQDVAEVVNAVAAKHFAAPPYRAETLGSAVAAVVNRNNVNCLTFPEEGHGRTLTAPHVAAIIASKWNNEVRADK